MELPLIGKVKQPSRWVVGLLATGVLVLGTAYVTSRAKPKFNLAEMTVPVESKNLTLRITASGTINPVDNVNLSPKEAGRLTALYVDQGDRVQQGQIIARMDDTDIQAQLVQFRGNLQQAQAQLDLARAGSRQEDIDQAKARLAQAQAQLDLAVAGNRPQDIAQVNAQVDAARAKVTLTTDRLTRNEQLYRQGAISKDALDAVVSDDRSARADLQRTQQQLAVSKIGSRSEDIAQQRGKVAELQQALRELEKGSRPEEIAQKEAAVTAAKGQLQAIEVQLDNTIIRTPFAGIVTQKYATVGAFVTPTTSASSTASATSSSIVALSRGLEVLANVPEVDVGQIKKGQSVEIRADAYPNQVFKGRVSLIAPEAVVQNNVTSFQVRVALVTGADKLRSGMNADLTFLGDQIPNALVVPTVAIVTQKGQTGVLVPNGNETAFHPVTIGPNIGNQIQILKGIQPGERVFVSLPKDQIDQTNQSQRPK